METMQKGVEAAETVGHVTHTHMHAHMHPHTTGYCGDLVSLSLSAVSGGDKETATAGIGSS